MQAFLTNFGIDWKILVAQIVNFSILVFLLQRFLYKPVMKMLESRRKQIEKADQHAKDIESKLENIDRLREELLAKARVESEKILKEATASAGSVSAKILEEARSEAKRSATEERKALALEKEKLLEDVRKEIGAAVAAAVEKTVGGASDESTNRKLVEDAVREIVKSS